MALSDHLIEAGLLWSIDPANTAAFNSGSITDGTAIDSYTIADGVYAGESFVGSGINRPTYTANVASSGFPGIAAVAANEQYLDWTPADTDDYENRVKNSYTIVGVMRRSTLSLAFAGRNIYRINGTTGEWIAMGQDGGVDMFRCRTGSSTNAYVNRLPPAETIQAFAVARTTGTAGTTVFTAHGQNKPTTDSGNSGTSIAGVSSVRVIGNTGTLAYDGNILLLACYEGALDYETIQAMLHDMQVEIDGAASGSSFAVTSANCEVTADGEVSVELAGELAGYVKLDPDNQPSISITSPKPDATTAARAVQVGGLKDLAISGGATTLVYGTDFPIFSAAAESGSPSLTVPASYIADTAGNSNAALTATAITNNSTRTYPKVIGQWAGKPNIAVEVLFSEGECQANHIEVVAGHVMGIMDVALTRNGSALATETDATKSPYDGSYVYGHTDDISGEADGDYVYRFTARANFGSSSTNRLFSDNTAHGPTIYQPTGAASALENSAVVVKDTGGTIYSTVYVTKAGNDSTGDGSSGLPYLTIGKAITEAESGGWTPTRIMLGDGTWDEDVTINATGYNRPLVIESISGNASDCVLDPTSNGSNQFNLVTAGASEYCYVILKGIRVVEPQTGDSSNSWYTVTGAGTEAVFLLDGCERFTTDRETCTEIRVPTFQRGVTITEVNDHGSGRNTSADGVAKDVLFTPGLPLVNAYINRLDQGATSLHTDFHQVLGSSLRDADANMIAQDITIIATNELAQFLLWEDTTIGSAISNILFRNIVYDRTASGASGGEIKNGEWDHILFEHVSQINRGFRIATPTATVGLYSVKNSVSQMSFDDGASSVAMVAWARNHFAGGQLLGIDKTSGGSFATLYTDRDNNNYAPASGSPLRSRLSGASDLVYPADLNGTPIPTDGTGSIGAVQAGTPAAPSPGLAPAGSTGAYAYAGERFVYIVFDANITYTEPGGFFVYPVSVSKPGGTPEAVNSLEVIDSNTLKIGFTGDTPAIGDSNWTVSISNGSGYITTTSNGAPIANQTDLAVAVTSESSVIYRGRSRDRNVWWGIR